MSCYVGKKLTFKNFLERKITLSTLFFNSLLQLSTLNSQLSTLNSLLQLSTLSFNSPSTLTMSNFVARADAFQALGSKEIISKHNAKTKMCQFTMKGKHCPIKNCGFAHLKSELSVPKCVFDHTCRFFNSSKPCLFVHTGEDASSYTSRTNKPWPLDVVVPPPPAVVASASSFKMIEDETYMAILCKKHDEEMSSASSSSASSSDEDDDFYPIVIVNNKVPTCTQPVLQPVYETVPQPVPQSVPQPVFYEVSVVVNTRNVDVYFSPEQFAMMFQQLNEMGIFFQSSPNSGIHAILRSDQFAILFPRLIQLGVSFQTQ